MVTNAALLTKLQTFEHQLNQTVKQSLDNHRQLVVGYWNHSASGPYYYIKADDEDANGYTTTGLWATIDELTKALGLYDKLTKQQIAIIQQFIHWLDTNSLLGANVSTHQSIQLHPVIDTFDANVIHP